MSRATKIAEYTEVIADFISDFLESSGGSKVKVADLLQEWQSEDKQEQLAALLKLHLPEIKPKKARKVDPNAPKRPRSAYILFCKDEREKVKEEFPGLSQPEIMSKMGARWKTVTPKRKKKYEKMSQKDKERYGEEKKAYAKPKGPKRPLSAYLLFCQEFRQQIKDENPDMKFTEVGKELGRMWREDYGDKKKRKKWMDLSSKEKERYKEEKESRNGSGSGNESEEGNESESGNESGNESENESTSSSMVNYIHKIRPKIERKHPDWSVKEVVTEVKRRWSNLSAEERAKY